MSGARTERQSDQRESEREIRQRSAGYEQPVSNLDARHQLRNSGPRRCHPDARRARSFHAFLHRPIRTPKNNGSQVNIFSGNPWGPASGRITTPRVTLHANARRGRPICLNGPDAGHSVMNAAMANSLLRRIDGAQQSASHPNCAALAPSIRCAKCLERCKLTARRPTFLRRSQW